MFFKYFLSSFGLDGGILWGDGHGFLRIPSVVQPKFTQKNDDDDLNPRVLLVCFVESLNQFFDSLESHRSSRVRSVRRWFLLNRQNRGPPRICSEISLNGPLQIYDWSLCICKFLLAGK